ncbi:MAG: hypothetical protein ACI9BD_000910, partial [Candidatus Marinamargulisbacteria bacterium]
KITLSLPKETKIGIFVGQGYDWHGIQEMVDLARNRPQIHLLIVGPYYSHPVPDNVTMTGPLSLETLTELYAHCHFGIGPMRWDLLDITEGSPLKTREYLFHGLPILVNYYDTANDFDALKPYVFNLKEDDDALEKLLVFPADKSTIKREAEAHLNWTSLLSPLLT